MSQFRESRKFSNEGSTLAEVLGRYLERRRRERPAKGKTIEDLPRTAADTCPDDPSRRTAGG